MMQRTQDLITSGKFGSFKRNFASTSLIYRLLQVRTTTIMPIPLPTGGELSATPHSFDEMRAAVRRFVGSRVKDSATADDLTQDVLLKVHLRLAQVRDPRRIMGWVIQIARNTIMDYFRAHRTSDEWVEEVHSSRGAPESASASEEDQLREDLNVYIRSVVQGLPAMYRDALLFTEFDGLTQVELAERLGLSISAAKSRVQRARAMVHQTIERCCHFQVDRYGTVLDYSPRRATCRCES
jgi:RNA polymerase sigma-70 factor, ECF subfamily